MEKKIQGEILEFLKTITTEELKKNPELKAKVIKLQRKVLKLN